MTLTDWASLLLADCSDVNLLGFSDWLELDQDDEELAQAARGVRELLVRQGKRPHGTWGIEFGWSFEGPADLEVDDDELPLKAYHTLSAFTSRTAFYCWYPCDPDEATAHLTALLDAAQAWAKCNPEPLTKGKVTT